MNLKPKKPDDSECCGSGCKPCVFDVYEEKLKNWELNKFKTQESKGLNDIQYTPFLITSVDCVTDNLKIFMFQTVLLKEKHQNTVIIKNASLGVDYETFKGFLNITSGEYLIMKGIYESDDEMITISRPYTPVLNKEQFSNGTFTIIVSLIKNGKMSQFLEKVNVNDIVFWRGPYLKFTYKPNSFQNILLLGGGTGVVPLYNIAKSIIENERDETWVNAICSFKTIESMILRQEFKNLTDYWNFKIQFFISAQNDPDGKLYHNESVVFNKFDEKALIKEMAKFEQNKVYVVVSGPDSFNKFVSEKLHELQIKAENMFVF